MRAGAFAGGLVVGAAVTAAAFLVFGRGPVARSRAGRADGQSATSAATTEAALREEIAALEARLASAPRRATADPAGAAPAGEAPTPAGAASTPGGDDPARTARRAAYARVREQLASVRDAAPGSASVLAVLKVWREQAEGTDALEAEVAGRALLRLADWEKLRDADVDVLAASFARLEAGAPGRAGLAATVARAWASDARLAGWFDALPPTEEPAIRATVVEALDESPSDAYREYLVRISRSEPHAEVLAEAWMEDPITVALTPDLAPRLIAAIEPRATKGDLPAAIRGRALFAIGLAGQFDPGSARGAIGRMIESEPDEAVRAFARAVLGAVDRGEANVQFLDGLWSRHRRGFGE